ncbi:site-specific recombinase [Methanomassiliicoccales archaeon RumEn M2]|nr:site-specific recombinase [Methanomassiliicoccales archaeon RumEn M2]
MAEGTRKRAALYARVSTEEQAQLGQSLEAQMESLRRFCAAHDLEVAGEYVDEGFSGRNTNRKAYRLMLSKEERMKWDTLVVLKMDRIHRNSRNFMEMMDDLKKNNQNFVSTYDKIDTGNAVGRFVMDMIQRIAQLESEQIGERTYMGMKEKASTGGGIMGFNPPFGYAIEEGELTAVEEELSVVKEIFAMYEGGMTMDAIAYRLNGSGTLTRRGNPWNKFNLRNILHNTVYAGYMSWDGILQEHGADRAVSPGRFNRVQDLMASKVRDPAKKNVVHVPDEDS